jgi:nicotinamidase/pyrazinamidase
LAEHADGYGIVVASRDWHDADNDNGGHFSDQPDYLDTWPQHCVAGTHGAEYHASLTVDRIDIHVKKGQGEPAYSIFEGTASGGEHDGDTVSNLLDHHGVTEIDLVGLATDHCVRASALDAIDHGRHVRVLTDLIAGVAAETSEAALAELGHAGAVITSSRVVD